MSEERQHLDDHRKWEDQLSDFFEAHAKGEQPRLFKEPYVELGEHMHDCRHCNAAYMTVSRSWITNPNWSPEDDSRKAHEAFKKALEGDCQRWGSTYQGWPFEDDSQEDSLAL
jgi:hypothetical protein